MPLPLKKQKTTNLLNSLNLLQIILPRNINAKKRAKDRDNFSCVLTGVKIIEVIQIYLYYSRRQKEEEKNKLLRLFWSSLRLFWPKEKVAAWEARLFP